MNSTTFKKAQDLTALIERYVELNKLLSDKYREAKGGAIPNFDNVLGEASRLNVIQPADLLPFIQEMIDDSNKQLTKTKDELEKL